MGVGNQMIFKVPSDINHLIFISSNFFSLIRWKTISSDGSKAVTQKNPQILLAEILLVLYAKIRVIFFQLKTTFFFLTPYFFLCILKHLSISLWSQKIIKNRFLSKNRTGVRICVFSTILYLSKVCRCLLVWVFICGFQQLDVIANQNIGRSIWWAQHRCFMCDSSSINQYLWGTL